MGNGIKKAKKEMDTSTTIEETTPIIPPRLSKEERESRNRSRSTSQIIRDNLQRKTPEELAKETRELNIQQEQVNADTRALIIPMQKTLAGKANALEEEATNSLFKRYQPEEHKKSTSGCFSFLFSLFRCSKEQVSDETKQPLLRK